ncbi:hypothetical protein LWC34_45485 [Kibdelosporangium philippinense]|uniref:Uncharacterized protein n=1 Tax=Kibdelosporangium philippinense TaxID=211113 RepID=A0ABS8ZQI4_9PSEU|nr:hypothetical protein [Kibdelosporangium philippinense]MCE7010013.1 hypothetical protein [Kibdelosporangium philippinense]
MTFDMAGALGVSAAVGEMSFDLEANDDRGTGTDLVNLEQERNWSGERA